MKENLKKNEAITLIALVVTIIVLIILAGVSISLILGQNGIITFAKKAKENMILAQIDEQKGLNNLSAEMNNVINGKTKELIENGIWRVKKSIEKNYNSEKVKIYVYSMYYSEQIIPDTLNEYKEQYIVKKINENAQQNVIDSLDELVLNNIGATNYTLINDYLKDNSINMTREEFIVSVLQLKCESSEYANTMLIQLGYTTEDILKIEEEYEEQKNNQNIIEIPNEIKNVTYKVTYPDGTTQEVLGSELNSFKGTYDVQNNGNHIITITELNEEIKIEVPIDEYTEELNKTIAPEDYGKSINYSVTVKNNNGEDVILDDWKVLYNDGTNVYIILGDYLNTTLIDTTKLNIKTENTYTVYWDSASGVNNAEAAEILRNTNNWSEFATGEGAKSATASPTAEMLMLSHNEKYETTFKYTDAATLKCGSYWNEYLYVPYGNAIDGCNGYWTTTIDETSDVNMFRVGSSGTYCSSTIRTNMYGLRPVVCLQTGVTGIISDNNVTM